MSSNPPVSWRTIIYDTPVISSDGQKVGKVHEVLGDDANDIFHGLRVALQEGGRDVMVASGNVTTLATDAIHVDLSKADVDALPTYEEAATYHLASVGWLRQHLGWKRDSDSDEEPG